MSDAPPWARQDGESVRAYDAFVAYRDLPPRERSLAKTAQRLGMNLTTVEEWSRQWGWVARVQAWTDEQDAVRREAALKVVADMAEAHARDAQRARQMLMLPILTVLQRMSQRDENGNPVPLERHLAGMPMSDLLDLATSAARTLKTVVEVERLARGLPTDTLALTGGEDAGSVNLPRNNPRAAALAIDLLDAIAGGDAGGEDDAGRVGVPDAVQEVEAVPLAASSQPRIDGPGGASA